MAHKRSGDISALITLFVIMVPLLELVRRLSVGIMASSSVMFSVFKDEEILRCV